MEFYYDQIKKFYGDRTAIRSGVPLMNHIDEGLRILDWLNASDDAKAAYCVHPLFQDDDCLERMLGGQAIKEYDPRIVGLAMAYREVANSWLSTTERGDGWTPPNLRAHDVKSMLQADKIQNYKDFLKYHQGNHPRSKELTEYFMDWLSYLHLDRSILFCLKLLDEVA